MAVSSYRNQIIDFRQAVLYVLFSCRQTMICFVFSLLEVIIFFVLQASVAL